MADPNRAPDDLPQSAVTGDEPGQADVPEHVRQAAFEGDPAAEEEVDRAWDRAQPMKGDAPTG